jgi:hypothetical protein
MPERMDLTSLDITSKRAPRVKPKGRLQWPRTKSLTKFKDTVRAKTKRTAGRSLAMVISTLNPTLRGWFEYFKHSHRWTFRTLDGWDTPTAAQPAAQAAETGRHGRSAR